MQFDKFVQHHTSNSLPTLVIPTNIYMTLTLQRLSSHETVSYGACWEMYSLVTRFPFVLDDN